MSEIDTVREHGNLLSQLKGSIVNALNDDNMDKVATLYESYVKELLEFNILAGASHDEKTRQLEILVKLSCVVIPFIVAKANTNESR